MEIDTEYTDFITCPYCGYEDQDSWEVDFGNSECTEIECTNCEKEINVTRHISVSYSAYKPKKK
jgi:transcription elongation factor Elf1